MHQQLLLKELVVFLCKFERKMGLKLGCQEGIVAEQQQAGTQLTGAPPVRVPLLAGLTAAVVPYRLEPPAPVARPPPATLGQAEGTDGCALSRACPCPCCHRWLSGCWRRPIPASSRPPCLLCARLRKKGKMILFFQKKVKMC